MNMENILGFQYSTNDLSLEKYPAEKIKTGTLNRLKLDKTNVKRTGAVSKE